MGIFDKLKKVGNFLAGGGAKLSIQLEQQIYEGDQPIKAKVICQVEDGDIKIRNAYAKIRAIEKISLKDIEKPHRKGTEIEIRKGDLQKSHQTYSAQVEIAPAQSLHANETYEWDIEFQIPPSANGSYAGYYATHEWSLYAGLDTSGNDPDSGWVVFTLRK